MKSVLYFGCPPPERADTEKQLEAVDVAVVWAESATGALGELERRNMPVLVDLTRGTAALQIAQEIRTQRAATLMFAVVDTRRPDLTTEAVLAGMADVFARPLGGRRVANAIEREPKYEAREAVALPPDEGDDLYAHSAAMRDVMALITRAAGMRAGVLVRGESGTGRQIAARAIHAMQRAGDGSFVVVDCAAWDGAELETELFGVAPRGQVNGTNPLRGLEQIKRRSRVFEACGGTLYLQHVAEAPTRVQARLARLLRDREAVLLDTGEITECDVRPMAGVDPDFDSAIADGRVRDDLFRRLSVIGIDMPALRNRREDIPALANCFLREICAGRRVPPKALSRSALSLLSAMPWRGNAEELRQLLDAVVGAMHGGRGIALEDVLPHVKLDGGSPSFYNGGTLKQARAVREGIHRGGTRTAPRTNG
jgi:DNA-binding NtrC family response regulator